jgi:hypothetical protein
MIRNISHVVNYSPPRPVLLEPHIRESIMNLRNLTFMFDSTIREVRHYSDGSVVVNENMMIVLFHCDHPESPVPHFSHKLNFGADTSIWPHVNDVLGIIT